MQLNTPEEVEHLLSTRVRELRLLAGWKQSSLAARAGVSLPTLRRFERTGRTTLASFLRICHALGQLDALAELLRPPEARTMTELERSVKRPPGLRGRR